MKAGRVVVVVVVTLAAAARLDAGTSLLFPPTTIFVADHQGQLLHFDAATPGRIDGVVSITGLAPGDVLRGIDFRPADGELYGVSSDRLYRIDAVSGVATAVGGPFAPALTGFAAGVDFSPVADRLRVVTTDQQNLRLHPESGGVSGVDFPLAYDAGDPHATAGP